jgi:hypothetical protein
MNRTIFLFIVLFSGYSNAEEPKVYTNEDLPPLSIGVEPSGDRNSERIESDRIVTYDNYVDTKGRNREDWQILIIDWELRSRRNRAETVQERERLALFKKLAVRSIDSDADYVERAEVGAYIQEIMESLKRLSDQRKELDDERDDMTTEARRTRALPGWLRLGPEAVRILIALEEPASAP